MEKQMQFRTYFLMGASCAESVHRKTIRFSCSPYDTLPIFCSRISLTESNWYRWF